MSELEDIGFAGVERRVQTIAGLDVGNLDSLKSSVDPTLKAFGRIDYLINNAGVARRVTLFSRAHAITARHPDDRDLRRFESAVVLGCDDEDRAYEARLEETVPGQRTRPGQFQALASSSLSVSPATAKLYGLWLREDFGKALRSQKPSLLTLVGLKSDAVDAQDEFYTFSCVIDVPELKIAKDEFCNEVYPGSPAAYTCSHEHEIKGCALQAPTSPMLSRWGRGTS